MKVFALSLTLLLAACAGGVKVNPGAVVEKSTEGPDGVTTSRAFYGAQVAEFTGGEAAPHYVGDRIKKALAETEGASASVSRTSNIVAGCVLAALAAFLGFLFFKSRR